MKRSFFPSATVLAILPLSVAAVACSSSSTPSAAPGDSGPDTSADTGIGDAPSDANDGGFSEKLSQTSLYKDWSTKAIADDVVMFEPAYQLWADGLKKRRWIELPAGQKINTADMDNWKFPVGTKFWKEFSVDGGKILETRLIQRVDVSIYRMGAYVWNDAQTEATWTTMGENNVLGTDHDVPDEAKCQACHNAAPGRINGFQAIQMSKPAGTGAAMVNLDWLVTKDWLSNPPAVGTQFKVPGDDVTRTALGYIHANCGHCHNPSWEFFALTNQVLRLTTDGLDKPENTNTYKTTIYRKTMSFHDVTYRVVPGDSANSCMFIRPTHRLDAVQMPPIATKHVDDAGTAEIKAWIDSLPKTPPPPDDAGVDGAPPDAAVDAGPG